jgi:hypothetical protein
MKVTQEHHNLKNNNYSKYNLSHKYKKIITLIIIVWNLIKI